MKLFILAGLALALCGAVILWITGRSRGGRAGGGGSALPGRTAAGRLPRAAGPTPPLPPRRPSPPAAVRRLTGAGAPNRGPRGVRPSQFPCCPYDKLRNVPGGRQVIFWDSAGDCYRCARGHRFKKNGKLL